MIFVREERPEDIDVIRIVNEQAFGQPAEASIVDKIRKSCPGLLSLVALAGDEVVGHIFFSSVKIEGSEKAIEGMGLVPVAVLPAWQRQGIGTLLGYAGHRDAQEPELSLYHRVGAS